MSYRSLLLPSLVLIAGALFVAACGGGGKPDLAAEATKVADQQPATSFDVVAKNNKFEQKVLVAKAGAQIEISLDNQDNGTLHNIAIYKGTDAKENVFRGEAFEGKKTVDETFTAPAAGAYYFRCDVHPDAMHGTFVAK
jgi:plastocyanin